ncbi:MAG: ATP-grasp domain-containing protein [Hyphomicrobiales bacterium]|nr:ATP-grasp domain-containing protein [Hyphomicrobiales bacterium]
MSSKTLMFVGAGRHQAGAIRHARALGYRVVACDGDPDAEGLRDADRAVVVDIRQPELCLRAATEHAVDAVVTVATEAGVRGAAYAAQQLGLPGPTVAAATAATDKLRMRQEFAHAGVASTAFRACSSAAEAEAAYRELGPQMVVKPATSSGSRGVSYVGHAQDLLAAYENARRIAGEDAVLVERFMAGVETAVEAFMVDGVFHLLCVSDKVRTTPPYLLDLRITYPSPRPAHECRAIAALAEQAARALNIRNAPLHAEVMMTAEGPRMVEIAARGAGFHVFTEIVPWVTGVDTVAAQIDLALGRRPDLQVQATRSAILDFPVAQPGTLTAIDGLAALATDDAVLFHEVFRKPGDRIGALRSGADRVAAICVRGTTLAEAQAALERAHGVFKVTTASPP